MDDFGDFGDIFGEPGGWDHVAGPLIGGGAAQVGTLAAKMIWASNANIQKWAPAIGLGVGAAVSGALMFSPKYRALGWSSLVTAAIVALPRQIEILMGTGVAAGGTKDYLGVTVPEQVMGAEEMLGMGAYGPASQLQVLDGGSGSSGVFGVTVPEAEMSGAGDVDLLGGNGFGSNFLG